MLVLSREVGDQIVVGSNRDIVITLVAVRGDRVRLGIEADASIPVQRAELKQTNSGVAEKPSGEVCHALGTSC